MSYALLRAGCFNHQPHAAMPNRRPGSDMKIRREQMEVLEAAASEAFLMRLIRFLRRRYAAAVNHLDDHSLEAGVRVAVARARGYGLKWESSLAIFVTATFVVGD